MNDNDDRILDVHPFLRPPMWRNLLARSQAEKAVLRAGTEGEDGAVTSIPRLETRDIWLHRSVKRELQRVGRDLSGLRHGCWVDRPPRCVATAADLNASSRPGGFRWLLEALICGGATNSQCLRLMGLPFDEETIEAYRRIYFDTDAYRSPDGTISRTALESNVVACSKSRLVTVESHDYMWKRFAIRFGADDFIGYTHGETKKAHRDWMVDLASRNNLEHALTFSESPERIGNVLGPLAIEYMKLPDSLKSRSEKSESEGASDFSEYFKIMGELCVTQLRVVSERSAFTDVRTIEGRGVQRITSGNLRLPEIIPQTV